MNSPRPIELIKVMRQHPEYPWLVEWIKTKAETCKDTGFRALEEKTRWENVGKYDVLMGLLKDFELLGKK